MRRAGVSLVAVITACDRGPQPAQPAQQVPAVAVPRPDAPPRADAPPSLLHKEGGTFVGLGTWEGEDMGLLGPACKRGEEQAQPTLPFPVALPAGVSVFAHWCLDGDTLFHRRGTKAGEGKLISGRPDGAWTYYRETGERLLSGRYINGDADGLWRAYDPDGTVTQLGCFRAGKRRWGVTGDKPPDDC